MLNVLKPFAGPAIILLVQVGLSISGIESRWWGGFLIGIAVVWAAFAILNNKRLVRQYPSLVDWLPFLAHLLDDKAPRPETPEELSGTFLKNRTVQLATLTHENVVSGRTFEDCIIVGPGIMSVRASVMLIECRFTERAEELFVCSANASGFTGSILVEDCVFRRCRFMGIGVWATAEQKNDFLAQAMQQGSFSWPRANS